MSSISVTVFKDSVGYHSAGVPKVINSPISSLGIDKALQYDIDIDMVGCGSDEVQPFTSLLKVFTPETGIIWVNETEASLAAKLYACCTGGGGTGGTGGSARFTLQSFEIVPGGAGFASLSLAGKTVNALFIGDYSKVIGFTQGGNNITFTDGTTVTTGDTVVILY